MLILPVIAALLQPSQEVKKAAKSESTDDVDQEYLDPFPVKPFITSYRGAMMIITCTSILAVDFPVFPRRFAKTENWGTSLMDLGVGSFVFSAGVVSARQELKEMMGDRKPFLQAFATRFANAVLHSLPLFFLGFIRLYSVKSLDYAEHVSEYGVHWNFFFTLALLGPAFALVQPIFQLVPSYGLLAFAIAVAYELHLFLTKNLKRYILIYPRGDDWLSQNREGVYSFIGYLAIFLAGMGIGMNILPRDTLAEGLGEAKADPLDEDDEWLESILGAGEGSEDKSKEKPAKSAKPATPESIAASRDPTLFSLIKWSGIWFLIAVWMLWRYGPRLTVSRRLANLAYVVWVSAFNTSQLTIFCLIESLLFPGLYGSKTKKEEKHKIREATSKVLHAFNRNGLPLFLLANLLTGAINMSMDTLHMGDVEAMAVLVSYVAVLCVVGLALDHYDVSLKF